MVYFKSFFLLLLQYVCTECDFFLGLNFTFHVFFGFKANCLNHYVQKHTWSEIRASKQTNSLFCH